MPKVVITLPAYRAARTLEKTVADIPEGVADKIILVDDASPDDTVSLARRLGIDVHVHPQNRGYGGNQKTCYTEALRAGADVVVLLHPDYQYDPKAVPLLIAPILAGDADMTFGSRFAGLGDPLGGGMPLYRFLGNRITTTAENLLLGSRFTDLHSGLRAYTRRGLLSLPYRGYSDDFMFDSELLVDAVTSGLRVVEVPIPTRYTKESSSIAVGPSLRYVTGSVGYCARRWASRGRRGHRSPVTIGRHRPGRSLGPGPVVDGTCALCGERSLVLVYPANVSGAVPVEEFACTTEALARHDDIVQCPRCGLVSSMPRMPVGEFIEGYRDVVDEDYLMEEANRRVLFEWFLRTLDAYALRGRNLFEVGSHVGLFLATARDAGWNARGIEPSKWAVQTGLERFGVDLRRGNVEELDEPDGSADVAVMLDVLEHLVDPLAALKAVRRVVDPEGLLVLSTVNLSGLHARLRKDRWPWFIRSHLHYFSPETLAAMLRDSGFRLVRWELVPRSFRLSYIAKRAREHGAIGALLNGVGAVADPAVPLGWLGDIAFVAARPASPKDEREPVH
jgi:SAM-dependent methyltransferase